MKNLKLVLSAIAAMAIIGSPVAAFDLDLSNIHVDGMMELKAQSAKNETDVNDTVNDQRNSTRHKIVLGVGGELTEGVKVRFEAVRTPLAPTGAGGEGQFGNAVQTLQGEQNNLRFENAYMELEDLVWGVTAKVGRVYVDTPGSYVSFAGHYDDDDMTVGGVDAFHLTRDFGPVKTNYLHATTNDTKPLGGTDYTVGNRRVVRALGAKVDLKDVTELGDDVSIPLGFTLHQATDQDGVNTNDNVSLGVYEFTAGLSLMENMFSFGIDYAMNTGHRNTNVASGAQVEYEGNLIALNATVNHEESGFSAWANFVQATGDDDTTEPSATTTKVKDKSWHDMGAFGMTPYKHFGEILGNNTTLIGATALYGFDLYDPLSAGADGQGRGLNVTNIGAGYVLPVADNSLKITADIIMAEVDKLRTTGNADATTLKKDIGTEIDLALHWKKSDTVSFKLGYAQFDPEKSSVELDNNSLDDTVVKYFARATINF